MDDKSFDMEEFENPGDFEFKLYGAWVSKKEIIIVDYEEHFDKALEILSELFPKKNIYMKARKPDYSIYRVMYKLGYMRLIYDRHGSYYIEKAKSHKKFTSFQQQILFNADSVECVEYVEKMKAIKDV